MFHVKLKKLMARAWGILNNEKGFIVPAIIGGAMAAGGLIGALKNKSKAPGIQQKGLEAIQGVDVPSQEEMMYTVDQMVQQGVLSPEEAQAIMADPSAMQDFVADPRYKQAQLEALSGLQGIYKEGGITPEEKANMAQVQDELGTALRGEREATMQSAQERGVGGSGLELAARLGAGQAATQAASRAAVDTAAQARERALNALQQSGQLAGQMGGQEFEQASRRAEAIDAINKFNVANRQNTEFANVAARTKTNEQNLAEKQRISDVNKEMENQRRQYNAQLPQTEYENKMKKAGAVAGQYGNLADIEEQKRARLDRLFGGLIGTGGTVASMGMKK